MKTGWREEEEKKKEEKTGKLGNKKKEAKYQGRVKEREKNGKR